MQFSVPWSKARLPPPALIRSVGNLWTANATSAGLLALAFACEFTEIAFLELS